MRSRLLVIAVVLAAGLGVGTNAFTAVDSDRGVTVETASDGNAYMSIEEGSIISTDGDQITVETATVTNRFAEPVDITIDYQITSSDGSTVAAGERTAADPVAIGSSFEPSATFTCDSTGSYTVEFDVTADGDSVYVETTEPRDFDIHCDSPMTGTEA